MIEPHVRIKSEPMNTVNSASIDPTDSNSLFTMNVSTTSEPSPEEILDQVGLSLNVANLTVDIGEDIRDRYSTGIDMFIVGDFRLWMLIGVLMCIFMVLGVENNMPENIGISGKFWQKIGIIVCCFVKIRIPRSRRQIEIFAKERKYSRKGLPVPKERSATAGKPAIPEASEEHPLTANNSMSSKTPAKSQKSLDIPRRQPDQISDNEAATDRSEISTYSQKTLTSQRSGKTETTV